MLGNSRQGFWSPFKTKFGVVCHCLWLAWTDAMRATIRSESMLLACRLQYHATLLWRLQLSHATAVRRCSHLLQFNPHLHCKVSLSNPSAAAPMYSPALDYISYPRTSGRLAIAWIHDPQQITALPVFFYSSLHTPAGPLPELPVAALSLVPKAWAVWRF